MPAIQITNEQASDATASGNDADEAYASGIINQDNVSFQPPIAGYTSLDSSARDQTKASVAQSFAINSRYFGPLAYNYTNTNPVQSGVIAEVEIASVVVPTYVPRKVVIHFHLSAWGTVIGTLAGFRVKADGAQIGSDLKYSYNVANDHRSMGGTWVGTIGPGNVTITGHLVRLGGTGVIRQDGNDIITLTVSG